ncbi:MAG: efflux transporter outer membrane subunit [Alphaproteobacteria bacterium]
MPRRLPLFAAGLLLALLPACTKVGPEYVPPDPEVPVVYDAPLPAPFVGAPAEGPWWRHFGDPVLNTLIAQGLEENLDVRTAASRAREANAVARGVDTRREPRLGVSGGPAFERTFEDGNGSGNGNGRGRDDDDHEGRLSATLLGSWEIDVFGGIERSREAAWAEAHRQEALQREARRLTAAEIARTYVQLRGTERLLALTEGSLELQRQTLELVTRRVEAGLAPGLDRVRAEAAVANLEADVGPLRSQADRFRNALAVLLAVPPGTIDLWLATPDNAIPRAGGGPAIGVPADLLRRRPDIQAAELRIVAATAEVGVAVADLYPRFTLPGTLTLGLTGLTGGGLVGSVVAAISALVDYTIYDAGERDAAVEAAEERVVQATLAYRQTLLNALAEVESALLGYRSLVERRAALSEAVRNNRLAFDQSQELYRRGFVSFIDVLDSQREWNASLQQLASAERDLSIEVVNLFGALGGEGAEAGQPGR